MSQTALTVGTEYTERMMSGTGTESDPWIIGGGDDERNLQNFFDAIYTQSAYIDIEKDIHAENSLTYREGLNESIYTYCTKIYSTVSAAITGLVVKSSKFLNVSKSLTLNGVRFLNCVHEGTGKTIHTGSSLTCIDCHFSFIRRGNNVCFCADLGSVRSTFTWCSIWYKVDASYTPYRYVFGDNLSFCQIYYDGPLLLGSSSSSGGLVGGKADRLGISGILHLTEANGSSPHVLFDDYGGNMDYIIFGGIIDNQLGEDITLGGNDNTLLSYEETGNATAVVSGSQMLRLSKDEITDRDYLYSIGFLP